jgi:hypothetical protein
MSRAHPAETLPTGVHGPPQAHAPPPAHPQQQQQQQQQQQPPVQSANQTAEFFLANYRLGKTLGIGSFGKVRAQQCSALDLKLELQLVIVSSGV